MKHPCAVRLDYRDISEVVVAVRPFQTLPKSAEIVVDLYVVVCLISVCKGHEKFVDAALVIVGNLLPKVFENSAQTSSVSHVLLLHGYVEYLSVRYKLAVLVVSPFEVDFFADPFDMASGLKCQCYVVYDVIVLYYGACKFDLLFTHGCVIMPIERRDPFMSL